MRCTKLVVRSLAAILLLLGARPAAAEWVDWIADAQVGFRYSDNLNVSAFNPDEEGDFSWHPRATVGRVFQLTDRTRVSLTAEVAGEIYHEFDRLTNVMGGGRVSVLHKFGIGDAPWVRADAFAGYTDVRADDWSGARYEIGLTTGKRFSPRLDASLGYRFVSRDGGELPEVLPTKPRDVFDQQFQLLTLSGRYLLSDRWLLSGGYTFRYGEFDSSCTVGNVARVLEKERVEAIGVNGVFGGCIYRLVGTGHEGFVNLNYALTERFSVDLGYRMQYGEADSLTYRSNIAQLSLLFRY